MSFPAYDEYKDSGVGWLGEIPSNWNVVALKYIARLKSGDGITGESIEETGEYPVYGGNGLRGYTDAFTHDGHYVVVGRQGALCGNINYANGRFWASEHAVVASPIKSVDTIWLGEMLRAMNLNQYSVSAAQPGLSMDLIGNLRTVLPPSDEQTAIASFLDAETSKIDSLVSEQRRLIELLKEKRQAVISHAVTKGLDPDVKMKDSGIQWLGEVPEHWDVRRLKFLCDVQTGSCDTKDAVDEGDYPFFVRSQNIERINSMAFDCEAVLTAGDGAGVGKVFHHFKGAFDFHQRVYMMNQFRHISVRLFFHYLKENFYKVALEGGAKSTVDSLRRPMLTDFPVCVPPEAEQGGIVEFIEDVSTKFDALSAQAELAIELLQERRTALISAAVTGKIDVRSYTE